MELPTREQVQLRNAEQRWIRPSELEDDLTQTERETQVGLCVSHDHLAMVICRNYSENLLAY